jgi:hypothetical protein
MSLSNVQFSGLPGSGVIVNSATIGNNFDYSGLAPKGVVVRSMIADTCSNGSEIQAGNVTTNSPAALYRFGVNIPVLPFGTCTSVDLE